MEQGQGRSRASRILLHHLLIERDSLGQLFLAFLRVVCGPIEIVQRGFLIKLSRFFDVTVDYLIIDEETRRSYPSGSPKNGQITALPTSIIKPRIYRSVKGFPLLDEQNVACYDEVPQSIRCDFTLRFTGDSMKKLNINDGDIVYASMMEDVRSHEVAVVLLDGTLTLRRVYKNENQIVLMAENPAYAPVVIRAGSNVRILGKAVAYLNPNATENPFH